MSVAVTGVESIELAPIAANGAMPVSGWVRIVDIEMDSVAITVPPLETVQIRVEDKSGIRFVLPGETDPASVTANSLDIEIDKANLLFKGLITSGAVEFNAPVSDQVHYLALRLTSMPFQGSKFQFFMPLGAITPGFTNNLSKQGMLALSFNAEATTPDDGDGNAVSPWGYRFLPVTT